MNDEVLRINPAVVELRATLGSTRQLHVERPVVLASGPLGFGAEVADLVDLRSVGLFVTRGVSLTARAGGGLPRVVEVPGGLLHAIGRENPGVDEVMERHGASWRAAPCAVAVSLVAAGTSDLKRLLRTLERRADALNIAAYELDLTVPAAELDGARWEANTDAALRLIDIAREAGERPLVVKVSPGAVDLARLSRDGIDAGLDLLSISGSPIGYLPDRFRHAAALAAGAGELSGPLVRPLALAAIAATAGLRGAPPIIGGGGIGSPADALDFFAAGATLVSLGSALWADAKLPAAVSESARRAAAARGHDTVAGLIGTALAPTR